MIIVETNRSTYELTYFQLSERVTWPGVEKNVHYFYAKLCIIVYQCPLNMFNTLLLRKVKALQFNLAHTIVM